MEFRKGEDGKDLVYSSIGGYVHISEYSSVNVDSRSDEQFQRHYCEREKQICENTYPTTSIAGMIKNAEGKINGEPIISLRGEMADVQWLPIANSSAVNATAAKERDSCCYCASVPTFQESRVRVWEEMLTPTLTSSLPFWVALPVEVPPHSVGLNLYGIR